MNTPRPTTHAKRPPERLATAETHVAQAEALAVDHVEGHDAFLGQVIDDRYRIARVLGEGGMGAVFVAEHLKLGSEVALKIIRPELAGHADLAARFAREAMASARLNHPHVTSALDYGTLPEGGAYLVMQLARGESLGDFLEAKGPLPWPLACEIAAQIADAMAAAHAIGIVHRDLKPDNVFVEERDDGTILCQVLDFGIARVQLDGASGPDVAAPGRALTTLGTIMGTPGYMAPEQAMGQAADPRADLYSLGVILSELVTGEPLFAGATLTAMITSQLRDGPPLIAERAVAVGLPPELAALLLRLVAPEPNDRPARAGEVRDALRALTRSDSDRPAPMRTGLVTSPSAALRRPTAGFGVPVLTVTGPDPLDRLLARLPAPMRALSSWQLGVGLLVVLVGASLGIASLFETPPPQPSRPTSVGAHVQEAVVPRALRPLVKTVISATRGPVAAQFDTLVEAEARAERRSAAEAILAHQPAEEVPPSARLAADLELARSCRDKRAAVIAMGELGDDAVIPLLERLDATPRRGCGFLNSKDCLSCLREDLGAAMKKLDP